MTVTTTLPKDVEVGSDGSETLALRSLTGTWSEGITTKTVQKNGDVVSETEFEFLTGALTSAARIIVRAQYDSPSKTDPKIRMSVRYITNSYTTDDVADTVADDNIEVLMAINLPLGHYPGNTDITRLIGVCLGIVYPSAATTSWGTSVFDQMRRGNTDIGL